MCKDHIWRLEMRNHQPHYELFNEEVEHAPTQVSLWSFVAQLNSTRCAMSLPNELRTSFRVTWGKFCFGAPTSRTALEQVAVMEQPIEHAGYGGRIAKQLDPVFHWTI